MRAGLAFTTAVLLSLGCVSQYGERNFVSYSPPVVIRLKSIQANDNNRVASFEMKNVGDLDMWYVGSIRPNRPAYFTVRELSDGGWSGNLDDDGSDSMDAGVRRLAAGTSSVFAVRFRASSIPVRYKVGVRFYASEFPTPSLPQPIYWSEPVSP